MNKIIPSSQARYANPYSYFNVHDINDIKCASTYEELAPVALRVIQRIPGDVGMVSGPISTGGKGFLHLNLAVFKKTIDDLANSGKPIFTQMPFENAMQHIKGRLLPGCDGDALLEKFYRPIFESGFIKKLYFIPGWQGSVGARWEHDLAKKLGIEIIYL